MAKMKLPPNTFDYDANNPEHAHVKHAIGMRVIRTFVRDHMQATTPRPRARRVALSSTSTKAYYHGAVNKA